MRYRKKKTIIIEIMNKNIKFVVFANFDLHAVTCILWKKTGTLQ